MNIFKITTADRKWYEIILWWELRRILYNIGMYCAGLLSFYIAYVTIPLIYLGVAFLLNVFYTLGWIIELLFYNKMSSGLKLKFPKIAFIIYFIMSALFIFGVAVYTYA